MRLKKFAICMLLTALIGTAITGCAPDGGQDDGGDESGDPASELDTAGGSGTVIERHEYKSVIIIGVDGAGTFFMDTDTPSVDRIFENGATTYNELTSNPTISAQCWGSLLTGVKPSLHGFTNESIEANENDGSGRYPTIFKQVKEQYQDAKLAAFCNWNPIYHGIIENNIGVETGTGDDENVTSQILSYLDKELPTVMFVQFDSVDHIGHERGYSSKVFYEQLTIVDGYIGQIYDKLGEKGYLEDTLFIVTADHGGINTVHGGLSDQEKYVFFGAVGKTINRTTELSLQVRDIPSIVTYALCVDNADTWDSYLPQNLFTDNMTPEARPASINGQLKAGAATPAKDSENYIGNYLDEAKIKTMLTFDGGLDDYVGAVTPEANGQISYSDGINGQSLSITPEGNVEIPELNFGNDSFSIALWLKIDSLEGDPCVYSNKNWDNGYLTGFVLCAREFLKFNVGNGSNIRSDFNYYYPDDYQGNWMHTLLVVDRESNTVSFYYNFMEESVQTMDAGLADISFDANRMTLHLGQDGRGLNPMKLNADYDDFIVYDGVMGEAEIEALKSYYANNG